MCFCVKIGVLVVMWLISGSVSWVSVGRGRLIWWVWLIVLRVLDLSWMLCEVLLMSFSMFLWVRVCRCFLVVLVDLKFSLVVILVWVGGVLVFLIVL